MKSLILSLSLAIGVLAQTSQPVVPPPPDRPVYGAADLALFVQYDRKSYEEKFGVQAPPFDATRPTKTWFDSTVASTSANYTIVKDGGLAVLTLSAADAKSVNLPGEYRYSAYVIAPTGAKISGVGGLNAQNMILRAEADQLASELGCAGQVVEYKGLGSYVYEFPADEPRRVYLVCGDHVAGALWAARNANGVGRRGVWDKFQFVPVPSVPSNELPSVAMPIRALAADETFFQTPFATEVRRMKGVTSVPSNPVASASAGEVAELKKMVAEIKELVMLLVLTKRSN